MLSLPMMGRDFPSFSEGLSLRQAGALAIVHGGRVFPFLFGRAFIEAAITTPAPLFVSISLPFRKGFH